MFFLSSNSFRFCNDLSSTANIFLFLTISALLYKNLVKEIKENENGVKYVFIQPRAEDVQDAAIGDMSAPRSAPEKTVGAMAKSALAKRS